MWWSSRRGTCHHCPPAHLPATGSSHTITLPPTPLTQAASLLSHLTHQPPPAVHVAYCYLPCTTAQAAPRSPAPLPATTGLNCITFFCPHASHWLKPSRCCSYASLGGEAAPGDRKRLGGMSATWGASALKCSPIDTPLLETPC